MEFDDENETEAVTAEEGFNILTSVHPDEKNRTIFDLWFRTYLSYHVPECYSASETTFVCDDDKVKSVIFDVLIGLFCGKAGLNFENLSQLLVSTNQTSSSSVRQICGHVFGNGEATYSCRICATDPTCVMCYECFSNSIHKNHKYRTSTSGGSGYCDCGDIEAWKEGPWCTHHEPSDSNDLIGSDQDSRMETGDENLTSSEFTIRARTILHSILDYSLQLLCWDYSDILPENVKSRRLVVNPFHTMLFNDETHSYDDVIKALTKSLGCSDDRATFFATLVDREGRASVRAAEMAECDEVREEISRLSTIGGTKAALIVETMNSCLVMHQSFAQKLLYWIAQCCQEFSPLLPITADVFLSELLSGTEETMLVNVLRKDAKLWKSARVCVHQFTMSIVLVNLATKKRFASIFAKFYPELVSDYAEDDHDHWLSVVSLTVQIFTVPSIARSLIAEENIIATIFDCIMKEARIYRNEHLNRLTFKPNAAHFNFRRSLHCLGDLQYLLTVWPEKRDDWTDSLRENFLKGFHRLIDFLSLMHYMNETVRRQGDHQEYESEWEMAFHIQTKLGPVITLFLKWIHSDIAISEACMAVTLQKASEASSKDEATTAEAFGFEAEVSKYNVSRDPISIHIPLHRLLTGLYLNVISLDLDSALNHSSFMNWKDFCEYPLRIFVLSSQVQCQMWRRNGNAIPSQLYNYSHAHCRAEMFDRDVLLMQMCASKIPPNDFLLQLLHRFNLTHWVSLVPRPLFKDESNKILSQLFDDFLQLLITIISEKYTPGVAVGVNAEKHIRYMVVQMLCKGPTTFSKLEKSLVSDQDDEDCPQLDQIVRSVADYRPPTGTSAGLFVLKHEFWPEYYPFFYLHSRPDLTKAEDYQYRERKSSSDVKIRGCPPPVAPSFTIFFQPINDLLLCDVFWKLASSVLGERREENHFGTEIHLHKMLYLINLALNEFENTNRDAIVQKLTSAEYKIPQCLEKLQHEFSLLHQLAMLPDLITYTNRRIKLILEPPKRETEMNFTEPDKNNDSNEDVIEREKKKRKDIAMKQREKAMKTISSMQNAFVKKHKIKLDDSHSTLKTGHILPTSERQSKQLCDDFPNCFKSIPDKNVITTGDSVTDHLECILCKEGDKGTNQDQRPFVYAAFVQGSTLFSKSHMRILGDEDAKDFLYPSADLFSGVHISCCGHAIHYECWQKYVDILLLTESRRAAAMRSFSFFLVEKCEFPCPLCKRISNAILPALPPVRQTNTISTVEQSFNFDNWLQHVRASMRRVKRDLLNGRWTPREPTPPRTVAIALDDALALPTLHRSAVATSSTTTAAAATLASVLAMTQPAAQMSAAAAAMMADLPATVGQALNQLVAAADVTTAAVRERLHFPHSIVSRLLPLSGLQNLLPATHDSNHITTFAQFIYTNGLRLEPDEKSPMILVCCWSTVAFTIRSFEAVLRFEQKALFGALTNREINGLKSLVRSTMAFTASSQSDLLSKHYARLLAALIEPKTGQKVQDSTNMCILEMDAFCLLTELIFACRGFHQEKSINTDDESIPGCSLNLPGHFSTFSSGEYFSLFRLCFSVNFVQLLTTFGEKTNRNSSPKMQLIDQDDPQMEMEQNQLEFVKFCLDLCQEMGYSMQNCDTTEMIRFMEDGLNHFLRLSSLFFNLLLDIDPPEALLDANIDEVKLLRRYMNLPTEIDGFLDILPMDLIKLWLGHSRFTLLVSTGSFVKQPVKENHLIELPHNFCALINKTAKFKCPSLMMDDSKSPAICLVCGCILCSQTYCCQVTINQDQQIGACTNHARFCSADKGMFLRIRDCLLMLTYQQTRGTYMPAPYVDEYGETDVGFKRRNPLILNGEMMKNLRSMWITQRIPESVASHIERSGGLSMNVIEWEHL